MIRKLPIGLMLTFSILSRIGAQTTATPQQSGTIIPGPPVYKGLIPTWTGADWSIGVGDPHTTAANVWLGAHHAQQDPTDPTHAFDSATGQNLNWDPDNNTWVDAMTGESLGFDGVQTTPPPKPPQMPGTTSMQGASGQPSVSMSGNVPSIGGFDGAVLFPLGNTVPVGPTASYEWVNSMIPKTVGAGPSASGSTAANDLNFTGEYTLNGNRVSILYQFSTPTGILVDAFSGNTSIAGTGTCGSSPLSLTVTCSGSGVTNDSNGETTTFQFTLLLNNSQPATLTFNSRGSMVSSILVSPISSNATEKNSSLEVVGANSRSFAISPNGTYRCDVIR